MYKKVLAATSLILLSACAGFQNTKIVEAPKEPVKEMLVVIEMPTFARGEVMQYENQSTALITRDLTKVFGENKIKAKPIFIPSFAAKSYGAWKIGQELKDSPWQYALWLRHVDGYKYCRYGSCAVHFGTDLRLVELSSGKVIWYAENTKGSTPHYGLGAWEDGSLYADILNSLAHDKIIALPKAQAIINIKTEQAN